MKKSLLRVWLRCIVSLKEKKVIFVFMPPPFEEWWRGIKCYPCPCVRPCVCACVRPSVIKIWCPLNNFWKTASIQFKFDMLIYNIKTQVEFNLGDNPLIMSPPPLGETYCFCLVRLSVYPSGCLSVCHTSFPLNNSSTLWPRAFKIHRVIALIT